MIANRKNACNGKVRHRDRTGAIIAMRKMKNKGLVTYRCPYCGGWHVGTSSDPWRQQKRLDQLLGVRP